jgi:hypothetical protein
MRSMPLWSDSSSLLEVLMLSARSLRISWCRLKSRLGIHYQQQNPHSTEDSQYLSILELSKLDKESTTLELLLDA